jgi:hypothetical protein
MPPSSADAKRRERTSMVRSSRLGSTRTTLTVIVQKQSLDSIDLCATGPRTCSLRRRIDLPAPGEAADDRAVAWPASQVLGTSSRAAGIASSRSVVRPVDLLPPLDYLRSFRQTYRPLNYHSASQPRNPMRIASHIATALSAATGRVDRPSDRPLVGAFGYWGTPSNTSEQGSRLKPE